MILTMSKIGEVVSLIQIKRLHGEAIDTRLKWEVKFTEWGIRTGYPQYERGKQKLCEMNLTAREYQEAIKQLAKWTGV